MLGGMLKSFEINTRYKYKILFLLVKCFIYLLGVIRPELALGAKLITGPIQVWKHHFGFQRCHYRKWGGQSSTPYNCFSTLLSIMALARSKMAFNIWGSHFGFWGHYGSFHFTVWQILVLFVCWWHKSTLC